MMVYALICIAFVLLGIVGLQFTYLFYVDRLYRERRAYLQRLEKRTRRLEAKLTAAEDIIAEQQSRLELLLPIDPLDDPDEIEWVDVIDEH
jgi:hypothetical protein